MWFDIAVIVLRAADVTVRFESVYLKSGFIFSQGGANSQECWTLHIDLSEVLQPLWTLDGGLARRKAAIDTQNKRTQTSIPRVGFEPMIPVLERAKTVHALDRAADRCDRLHIDLMVRI
jgi:hypothetical protein